MKKKNPDSGPKAKGICSICGGEYFGFRNNAAPIGNGRCCDGCDALVIANRIACYLRNESVAKPVWQLTPEREK